MKTVGIALIAVILLGNGSNLWAGTPKFPDNPDRYPSLTLMGSLENGSGEVTVTDMVGTSASQDSDLGGKSLHAILTYPISNNTSLSGSVSIYSSDSKADANQYFNEYESKSSSVRFTLGLTVYFLGAE